MTKLTKEEYLEALDDFNEPSNRYIDDSDKNLAIFEDLIYEHFELLEKYDDVCDKFHDDHFELENLKREYKLLELELKQKEKALDKACEEIHVLNENDGCYSCCLENEPKTNCSKGGYCLNCKEKWKKYLLSEVKEDESKNPEFGASAL